MAKFVHFIRQKPSLSSPTFNHTRVSQIVVLSAGTGYAKVPEVIISLPDLVTSVLSLKTLPQLTVYGAAGSTNQIQWANALGITTAWEPLTNVVLTSNSCVFSDTISPPSSKGFYRAVVQGGTCPTPPVGFVWLPAGQFTMGTPLGLPGALDP